MTYDKARVGISAKGTDDQAVANTETVVLQLVVPAGTLRAGDMFQFEAWMTRAGTTSASPVIRIRVGPTTLIGNIAATLTPPVDTLAVGQKIEGILTVRSIGASGTFLGSLVRLLHLAAVTIQPAFGVSTGTVTGDTTGALKLELTFISGNAANTYTFRNAVAYKAN